ncbi:hypothetical protein ACFL27_22740 [candidate division CSSED10-310 bacterium]|uniref:JAB domain-containing protein n=1 Tax=candidate division CSSED10-310 bacterium TaxID=2855610 RepID=A0ABV6Z3J9_UNCC1
MTYLSSRRLNGKSRTLYLAVLFFFALTDYVSSHEYSSGYDFTASHRVAPTQDIIVQDYFYNLWKNSGFGFMDFERSAFLLYDESGFAFFKWGAVVNHRRRQMYIGCIPENAIAIVHTHPNIGVSVPSWIDKKTGTAHNLMMYVLSRDGVWKYNPATKKITHDEGRSYWKLIKIRRMREYGPKWNLITSSRVFYSKVKNRIKRLIVSD